jgi:hypothetical protein
MASPECRSFIMNDIKEELDAGREVTHILEVKVANDHGAARRIKAAIFKRIANKPITRYIEGYQVTMKWSTRARTSSACYFCDSMFNNNFVNKHTKILLGDIVKEIDAEFQHTFTKHNTGLAFLVCVPSLYEYPDPNQFDRYFLGGRSRPINEQNEG